MKSCKQSSSSNVYLFHYCFIIVLVYVTVVEARSSNRSFYTFGDSITDPGNNNYILTVFRSNFPPYGREFINGTATGRFADSFIIPDLIASYIGLKNYPRPYLDPKHSVMDLLTSVSFSSGGTGFDPVTPLIFNVIPISKQLENFRAMRRKLEAAVGKKKADDTIGSSLVYVAAGSDDFLLNYFNRLTPLSRQTTFNISSYEKFLLQHVGEFIQGLLEEGVQRIAFSGLPPLGCIPLAITLYSNNTSNAAATRNCVEELNTVAKDFNSMLQPELMMIQSKYNGSKIAYYDVYTSLFDIITNPHKYGFNQVNKGCCGTGTFEIGPLCNLLTPVCPDASKYVFWDSVHPTKKGYLIIFAGNQRIIDSLVN